jgi:hypothetical protein
MFGDTRLPERFWKKVITEPNSGCWLWLGEISKHGTAKFRLGREHIAAHRLAYLTFIGNPSAKIFQTCKERSCCNPDHLYSKEWTESYRRAYKLKWAREALAKRPELREVRRQANQDRYWKDPAKAAEAARRWKAANRESVKASTRRWIEKNPDKYKAGIRRAHLRRYGLTPEQFDHMVESQQGGCGICRTQLDLSARGKSAAHIDHCHVTGVVRGILCNNCNLALGLFADDTDRMMQAVAYLKKER